jgi:quinol monooxygenase YgiN
MILEVAEIRVKRGHDEEFIDGVADAMPLFLRAKGCHGISLHKVLELQDVYRLVVKWDTVEDHTVHFRNSSEFTEWRRLVGCYFEAPPVVTHLEQLLEASVPA